MCEENESEKAILRVQHWDKLVECLETTYITSTSATTETSNRNKSLEYFVHNHPLKSWWLVYRSLQRVGHIMQARYVKNKYIGELHTSHMHAELSMHMYNHVWCCNFFFQMSPRHQNLM